MNIQQIKVEELKPYDKNAKIHTKDQIKKVAASIKKFGFLQPLVVDNSKCVIVGHGRLLAAQQLKMPTVPVVFVQNLTDEEIKAYRLADNKLNESDWDMVLVLNEVDTLDIELQELTGLDMEELKFEPIKDSEVERLDEKSSITCPNCGHTFT